MSDAHEHKNDVAYEATDVDQKSIVWVTVVSLVILVVSLVLLRDIFTLWKEKDMRDYVYGVESLTLRQIRADEAHKLHSYELVDSTAGVYRIPIERAMQIIAAEEFQRQSR
ncbi:MAG TPA: hypothetical protein VLB27_07310 [candidate division Zixibacteria bacterium]|nr:hypothetical protein [candidate division Zixibacteria bacterium]